MSGTLKIGQLAKKSGVTTKTIRYYELIGLIHETDRTDSGYRLYDEQDVERRIFMRQDNNRGFPL